MENFYNLTIEGDLLHIYEVCDGDKIMQQDCRPLSDVVGWKLDIGTFHEENVRLRQERDDAQREASMFKDALEFYTSTESEAGEILAKNAQLAALVGALREALNGAIFSLGGALGIIPEGVDHDSLLYNAENAIDKLRIALALTPPEALAELEARVRGEERERVGRAIISEGFWTDEMSERVLAIICEADDA